MPQPLDAQDTVSEILIALGSNVTSSVGAPAQTLACAIDKLREEGVRIAAVSRFYSTPCFPAGAGPDYVNAALVARTQMPPAELLALLHKTEAAFGRERAERWGQRTLDLDLVAYDQLVLPDLETFEAWRALPSDLQRMRAPEELVLPHPRLQDRAFVLIPLRDVAPDWRHPVLGLTVAQMLTALPAASTSDVTPVS